VKAPKWAMDARATLLAGEFAEEEAWNGAVEAWWALEASTRFVSPTKGFATTARPAEIHNWIKCARKGTPKIGNTVAFVSTWADWWRAINPTWRVVDGELVKVVKGSWEVMRVPGANGFLSVLVALKWWRELTGETGEWSAAIRDVTWVLNAL
ncbi:hypothetical protein C8R43DRAFT_853617, partial [Mycena crocata]